jgi:hypothetical protein
MYNAVNKDVVFPTFWHFVDQLYLYLVGGGAMVVSEHKEGLFPSLYFTENKSELFRKSGLILFGW